MQEHIRRAHPEHYLPKLPATEESFQLMINTEPQPKPLPLPLPPPQVNISAPAMPESESFVAMPRIDHSQVSGYPPIDRRMFYTNGSRANTPRILDEYHDGPLLPAASAAAALAQLHTQRVDEWQSEIVSQSCI